MTKRLVENNNSNKGFSVFYILLTLLTQGRQRYRM